MISLTPGILQGCPRVFLSLGVLVDAVTFLLHLRGQCFCELRFTSYSKSTPHRPNKSDYQYETHQEADDRRKRQCLPPEDVDHEAWTKATGQRVHRHLAQLPKDGPQTQLHRGPQPLRGPSARDCPVTMEPPATKDG
uniref:Uncharacterized protein n=1 Tax=Molossus molossus TaxID=27622 RepID=A0A7J8I0Z5_MOLMO|nr:hypothetical protein HJG59_010834 [Molossus molossus]